MTAFAYATGWIGFAAPLEPPAPADLRPTCVVQLINRATGKEHRINGQPLVLFTRDPEEVEAGLMRNRDPRDWETRVELLIPLRRE